MTSPCLREQKAAVSLRQVRQAAKQSRWNPLRQELVKRYHAGCSTRIHGKCPLELAGYAIGT